MICRAKVQKRPVCGKGWPEAYMSNIAIGCQVVKMVSDGQLFVRCLYSVVSDGVQWFQLLSGGEDGVGGGGGV